MKNKDALITQLNIKLSELIRLRIESYHLIHLSKIDLVNKLMVCPFQGQWENNDIRIPVDAINHFIQNLNINLIEFQHAHISLKPNMAVSYQLSFSPYFLAEEEDGFDEDDVYIDYCDGVIEFRFLDEYIDMLSKLTVKTLMKHIQTIQGEISFGTIKSGYCI